MLRWGERGRGGGIQETFFFLWIFLLSFNYPCYIEPLSPGLAKLEMRTTFAITEVATPRGDLSLTLRPTREFIKARIIRKPLVLWPSFHFPRTEKRDFPPKVSDCTGCQLLELVPLGPAGYVLI